MSAYDRFYNHCIDETGKIHILDFAVQLVQPSMESILIISGI